MLPVVPDTQALESPSVPGKEIMRLEAVLLVALSMKLTAVLFIALQIRDCHWEHLSLLFVAVDVAAVVEVVAEDSGETQGRAWSLTQVLSSHLHPEKEQRSSLGPSRAAVAPRPEHKSSPEHCGFQGFLPPQSTMRLSRSHRQKVFVELLLLCHACSVLQLSPTSRRFTS